MSTSVNQSFIRDYAQDVHQAFQRRGSLMLNSVRRKNNVKGSSTTFQKVGKGVATTKARHGKITPMNQDHTPIECTLSDYYAGDYVDKLDEAKTNSDERMVIANGGAWALGRKSDELVITAADATTNFVGDYSTGVTRTLLLQALETLNANDVPNDGQRFGFLTPRQWSAALTIDEFSSSDYVGDQPWVKAFGARTWLGATWMQHTGLNGQGTAQAKGMVWHKTAIGHASGADIIADFWWNGERAAHFINHMMSQGAALIDADGVVEIRTDDTAAIPT